MFTLETFDLLFNEKPTSYNNEVASWDEHGMRFSIIRQCLLLSSPCAVLINVVMTKINTKINKYCVLIILLSHTSVWYL